MRFRIDDVKKRTGHHRNDGVMAYDVLNKRQIAAQSAALYGVNPDAKAKDCTEDQNYDKICDHLKILSFKSSLLSKVPSMEVILKNVHVLNINFHF